MSDIAFYFRSRLFARRPGETHEDAIERYWETMDRKFEQWRDDQVIKASNQSDEKDQQH
jgi:hypothetical protein